MKHIHLIGIGGTGLSAIALVLLESGYQVSGSDRQLSPLAERVKAAGGRVFIGHAVENVTGADVIVRSSAVSDDNVEVQAALQAGIPVLKRAEFLGQLLSQYRSIAIAGSHGKTTTTAMIAWMLAALGKKPSYIIGGVSHNLGSNARAGKGPYFVIEADEYDRMFLGLQPEVAVITNVEHDHPDCFPTAEDFFSAFAAFARRLASGGTLIASGEDPGTVRLLAGLDRDDLSVKTYGILNNPDQQPGFDFEARNLQATSGGSFRCDVFYRIGEAITDRIPVPLNLKVPGEHNIRNALAAVAVASRLGLPLDQAVHAVNSFSGTGRRFEVRGEAGGVTVIDDYAHHPTEIRATLAAARARYPDRRIWAVWQPHTYSRSRTLLADFARAFQDADRVLVLDIYAAREQPPADGFSARHIVESLAHHPGAAYTGSLDRAAEVLHDSLGPGDVLLVLSAGDADQLSARVLADLAQDQLFGATAGRKGNHG